jgi:hypothetical protein
MGEAAAAALREVLAARARAPVSPDVGAAADAVRAVAGESLRALVFFGSRRTGARPDAASAYDFFAVVDGYRAFYAHAGRAGVLRARGALAAALNTFLPPNQVAVTVPSPSGQEGRAKCAVIRSDHFRRETSWRRHDHFLLGRLFQPSSLVFAADTEAAAEAMEGLARAHDLTWRWGRAWLPARFDVETYCRTLLRVSFAAEIRPEPEGRADALWRAQEADQRAAYGPFLTGLVADGDLRDAGEGLFELPAPPGRLERLRLAAYFRWSLVRATTRWLKHIVTFEGWLDFIVRKARRHSGQQITLSERERRHPLVFLWPRLIRYLRHKDR